MTKIIYLGGNRLTDKDLTVGKVYEMIDSDNYDGVRVHDDVWDIHSITKNAYRKVIEQSVNIGDTVAVTYECTSKDLVGEIGRVIGAIDDFGAMYFKVQFENQINTKEWGEVKNIVLRDNRLVLIEEDSKPGSLRYEPALTDDEIQELGELLSNITKYEDAYNFSKKRYKESKQRIKELKQKGGLS